MSQIPIDKNIPIPTEVLDNKKYPLADMQIEDSFFVQHKIPRIAEARIKTQIYIFQKLEENKDKIFTIIPTPIGVRCWRIK